MEMNAVENVVSESEVRVVYSGQCPSVSGKSTVAFEFGVEGDRKVKFRITANSGGGMFAKDWVSMQEVIEVLRDGVTQGTIAARAFGPVFLGRSINTQSFLLAVLKHEGVVGIHPDRPRAYQVCDVAAFEARIEALGSASVAVMGEGSELPVKPNKRPVLKLKKKAAAGSRE